MLLWALKLQVHHGVGVANELFSFAFQSMEEEFNLIQMIFWSLLNDQHQVTTYNQENVHLVNQSIN